MSLKQNGVFTVVITSGYTDSHAAHTIHNERPAALPPSAVRLDGRRSNAPSTLTIRRAKPPRPVCPVCHPALCIDASLVHLSVPSVVPTAGTSSAPAPRDATNRRGGNAFFYVGEVFNHRRRQYLQQAEGLHGQNTSYHRIDAAPCTYMNDMYFWSHHAHLGEMLLAALLFLFRGACGEHHHPAQGGQSFSSLCNVVEVTAT